MAWVKLQLRYAYMNAGRGSAVEWACLSAGKVTCGNRPPVADGRPVRPGHQLGRLPGSVSFDIFAGVLVGLVDAFSGWMLVVEVEPGHRQLPA